MVGWLLSENTKIPRLNMPRKSHESVKPTPRPARSIAKEHVQQPKACYKSFGELCQRITGLKTLKGWKFKTISDRLILKKTVEPFLLPEVEIMIGTERWKFPYHLLNFPVYSLSSAKNNYM